MRTVSSSSWTWRTRKPPQRPEATDGGRAIETAVAGILTRPPLHGNSETQPSVEPGATVSRGAALFSIADTSSFTVAGAVDELDVNRVRIDQAVTIVSDAFPGSTINGRIVSVSAEAESGRHTSGAPSFGVRASFSIDDEALRKAVRIGMSARMTVETYSNQAALIVPPSAVIRSETEPRLRIRKGGKVIMVPVLLGATFPQEIEVVSGIDP